MRKIILDRLRIVSTISVCGECGASKNWLGLNSPKNKIRDSGLWLVNELYKKEMANSDFLKLERLIRGKRDSLI